MARKFHARSFEASGCLSKLMCLNSKSCIKMATTDAYTATGIKFQRKRDTADVSKVSRKSFCRVQIDSTAAVLAPAVVISFQSVTLRDDKESSY